MRPVRLGLALEVIESTFTLPLCLSADVDLMVHRKAVTVCRMNANGHGKA